MVSPMFAAAVPVPREVVAQTVAGAKPRNVVFILADDHRYDAMSFMGHPFARTPQLDAMARHGVHLKNALVTTSLCSPSRASILTGLYTFRHRVIDNNRPIPEGTVYFPQYLQKAGYATAFIGKWHMGGDSDEARPGFDHWISFRGQGNYLPPSPDYTLNVNGQRVKQKGYITDELTDYAVEWHVGADRYRVTGYLPGWDSATSKQVASDQVRPALRQFKDQPLYALACAGTLALAVGAACVSFAVVKRAFIDPLPYRADHELVSLLTVSDGMSSAMSPHVLADLRASSPPLVEFAPIRPTGVPYTVDGVTETLGVSFVTLDYFGLLGVSPAPGRVWTAQEPDAIVMSSAFWRDKLGRDLGAVGSSIIVEGRPRVIVGIMPLDFMPPYFQATDAWAPIDMPTLLADLLGLVLDVLLLLAGELRLVGSFRFTSLDCDLAGACAGRDC